jgi:general secretion pathway protein D
VNAPAIGTISGILTDPQFRVVIRALEQRDGVDLLNESTVTTLSGRQTQIQIVDLITIVEQANVAAQGGNTTPTTGVGTTVNNSIPTVNYPTETLPFGPTLDVIPYVSADGFTVQMTILPTLTEFLGYDDPGKFVPQAQAVGGSSIGVPITAELPLPHFRVRQVSANVSESSQTKKKNLVIFVTPRIIDAAGNPYHTEDEMPFGPNGIPPQTPVAMASPAPMAPMAPPPPPPVIAPTPEAPAP